MKGLEIIMDHNLQVLLAIGISAALCLVTWIWARRCRTSVSHGKAIDGKDSITGLRSCALSVFRFAVACSEDPRRYGHGTTSSE
jgi:hypothetical protein